jgi:hypothetical protein
MCRSPMHQPCGRPTTRSSGWRPPPRRCSPPGDPTRPPNALDPGPRHHARQHRPPMRPSSRHEDTARLGAGGGDWSTTDGSTRRPAPPRPPSEGLAAQRRPAAIGTAARSTRPIRRRRVTRRSCVARRGWRGCRRSTRGTSALPNPEAEDARGRGGPCKALIAGAPAPRARRVRSTSRVRRRRHTSDGR